MGIISRSLENFDIKDFVLRENEHLSKNSKIYEKQVECALNIIRSFDGAFPRPNYVIVQGKTQAGKTGVLVSLMCLLKDPDRDIASLMGVKRVYYITGDNSCIMKEQNRRRLWNVSGLEVLFMKNSDMQKDLKSNEEIRNAIIFIDESHYGTLDEYNVLPKWMEKRGLDLKNSLDLINKKVFIISNSATPYFEMNSDIVKVKNIVRLKTDDWEEGGAYVGFEDFCNNNQIVGCNQRLTHKNLECYCEQVFAHLKSERDRGKELVAIIRVNNSSFYRKNKEIFEKYFIVNEYANSKHSNISYDSINNLLEHNNEWEIGLDGKSLLPKLVLIYGAYRMGTTIPIYAKRNIGCIVDITGNCGDEAIITTEQGLLGRMTGYWTYKGCLVDDWKQVKFFLNSIQFAKLKRSYIEKETEDRTDKEGNKNPTLYCTGAQKIFIPDSNGQSVGVVESQEGIVEYDTNGEIDLTQEEYTPLIYKWLESKDSRFRDLLPLPGRRNRLKPAFACQERETALKLTKKENLNKKCYTFVCHGKTIGPSDNPNIIQVLFGIVRKGTYVDKKKEGKKVKTFETK